jgi:hypothetical protein
MLITSCARLCQDWPAGAVSSIWSRRSSPAATVSRPAAWSSRGAGPARPVPPSASCSAEPNTTEQPPSTANPLIMIHG